MKDGEIFQEGDESKRIPLRLKQQIGMLLLFSFPAVLIALIAKATEFESRPLVIESAMLVFANTLGWICIVSALSASQEAITDGSGRVWGPRIEALLGMGIKLFALVWVVLRFLSGGLSFAAAFLGTLVAYLGLVLLLIILQKTVSKISPKKTLPPPL